MNNTTYNRDQVIERLRKAEPTLVTFTKVNGERREMNCTINDKNIPQEFAPKGNSEKEFNPDIIRVFDLDINAWRSFRLNSIISVK